MILWQGSRNKGNRSKKKKGKVQFAFGKVTTDPVERRFGVGDGPSFHGALTSWLWGEGERETSGDLPGKIKLFPNCLADNSVEQLFWRLFLRQKTFGDTFPKMEKVNTKRDTVSL